MAEIIEVATPDLTLSRDQAYYILLRAREFDEKVEETDPDSGSNASDDADVDVLEDREDDPTESELVEAVNALNDDEQLDLIALVWVGRGDFELGEWAEARDAARDIGRERLPRYLLQIPLLSDYLAEGLAQLGFSLEEFVDSH